ncbi:hypothetical protein [Caldivirga maquilingensis]|uniref:Uncharacterized protein n=1 Tax=Caldivirga maquilingensis (strain ATCC 700844 / DSM 13496 / JCM 10307 / IC-167) TaxID=397948 RepID=A8M9Z4_CALMQ|nr:hypothetical protein [Caldivirga maquilingensis]ABW02465.1 hypothetical protein Cmaq_1642 [Caldivirga maquilingensis IC-167]
MRNTRLKLKAIHAGLREFTLRYLLFSIASSIALISILIAHYAVAYNQQYNGGLVKVSVDYGVITLNGVKVSFYIINTAYASIYGFHVKDNECITFIELTGNLRAQAAQLLNCTLIRDYPYGYPIIIKFTNSSNTSNGILIIPQNPSAYFTARLFSELTNYTWLIYVVFSVIITLSSFYISLNYLNYLTDAFKRLRLMIGDEAVAAIAYTPLLTAVLYVIIVIAEYVLIKHVLSMEKFISINLSSPITVLMEPLIIILLPMLMILVISWRRSSWY